MNRTLRIGLGLRLLFAFFLINGIAALFVLRIFTAEIKPSAREVMEDTLVDTANVLAELAAQDFPPGSPDLPGAQASPSAGTPAPVFTGTRFANSVDAYIKRPVQARIWGLHKTQVDYRIYVTDARGQVLYDSAHLAEGQDFSQWRDVYLTLRGQYGARTSPENPDDPASSVMHVAAPIYQQGRIIGVLTVSKPNRTVQGFIDRAERKIMANGLWLLGLSALVGVLVTLWLVWNVRKLQRYANSVQAGGQAALPIPRVPGELGELAQSMDAMRRRLEGREYIEHYVRTLTHELKSPVAAIRGAAELLEDELPAADRERFARQIGSQAERIQQLVDRLLQLNKLEQLQALPKPQAALLSDCAQEAMRLQQARAELRGIRLVFSGTSPQPLPLDRDLVVLACSNLLANAIDFSPVESTVGVHVEGLTLSVEDHGPGVPDYALPRLGERFFTTQRPDGSRSGSGLGLAIVHQVMLLHHGAVRFQPLSPGLRVTLDFRSPSARPTP